MSLRRKMSTILMTCESLAGWFRLFYVFEVGPVPVGRVRVVVRIGLWRERRKNQRARAGTGSSRGWR